jgi:hypothetical protein
MRIRCCVTKQSRTASGCRETGVTVEVLTSRKGCCNNGASASTEPIDSQWGAAGVREHLLIIRCLRCLLPVMAACLVVVRSARCRNDRPGYKAVNRRSAIINEQSANDSIKPVFTALTWNAAACISTPAPLSKATVSLHRIKCILLVPVFHSHFTSPKRRLGVASSVH